MPTLKKDADTEFVRNIFLALCSRWDVKDKASAKNLARYALEIAAGYNEVIKPVPVMTKP